MHVETERGVYRLLAGRVKLKEACLLSARLAFSVFTTAGTHKSCDITSCHVQPPHIPRGAGEHPPLSE